MTRPGDGPDADRRFLERARALAREGWQRVHPNPMVGCVLVLDGEVVGEGHHAEFGGAHAERVALERAGARARGATAYVSLEPCAHHGKTPPCTEALVEAGVERVVYGAPDPGTRSGGGGRALREAGVRVDGPLLSPDESRRDNPAFFHAAESDLPYVALKLAVSLDGRIAAAPGRRTALTGPEALRRVHRLRAGFPAIMVGARTVEVDDPLLTVRQGARPRRPPWRLILDSRCSTSPEARLFEDVDRAPVVVFTTGEAPAERVRALEDVGARVVRRPGGPGGVDLRSTLAWCAEHELESVLCEGGGTLATSLLRQSLCQRIVLHLAPRILGRDAVPAFPAPQAEDREEGGQADLLGEWRIVEAEANVGRDGIVVLEPGRSDTDGSETESERETDGGSETAGGWDTDGGSGTDAGSDRSDRGRPGPEDAGRTDGGG